MPALLRKLLSTLPGARVAAALATAVAVGVAADLLVDTGTWRLLLAAATVAVLAAPRLAPGWLGKRAEATLLALLAVASLSQAAALDLVRFATTPQVRVWNVYHYYLGAKYFPELGYHDLYDATLAADRQGADYWRETSRVRNLGTYRVEPRAASEARYRPEASFSPERWRAFRADVEALQVQLPPHSWRGIFTDRGYNPSPLWTTLGRGLTHLLPATSLPALKLLTSLDLLLLAGTFLFVWRTFGGRAAALVLLFLTLTPVNDGRLVGGFLQYDWFCSLALGFCLLRRGRPVGAAALVAYPVMTRLFPLVFVAAAALPLIAGWVMSGRARRRHLRFFLAFALFALSGVALGTLNGRGIDAWRDFGANLAHHSEEHRYGQRRVGLQHLFTHDLRSLEIDESIAERRQLFERQKGLYAATAALLLGAWLAALYRRKLPDAFLLGLVPLFVLAVSSRYYWSYLALLPLLARPGPAGRRRAGWLAAAQAALYGLYYLFTTSAEPDRYAAYVVFNALLLAFFALLLTFYLRHDLRVLRRASGHRPWHRSRAWTLGLMAGLFVVLCALRMPLQDVPIRDVDESVSALIAASWLEGGVPYRDAIDQRGPVTYLVYAVVFAIAGVHDMWAVHWALLLLVLLGCYLLLRLGRALEPGSSGAQLGYLAAFLLAVCSVTYRRSQMLAFHTEWPMMVLTTLAMLALWRGLQKGGRGPFVLAGLGFAGAFLSKQPALFDAAAGGLFVLLAQARAGRLLSRQTLERAALLAAGFFGLLGATVVYFAAHGALGDFYLYFWSYNVEHYTAVVPVGERFAALDPFAHRRHYLTANPLLLAGAGWQTAAALWALVRRRRVDGRLLLALWLAAAYFGASFSGRNFGHYFIQVLPPACLLTAWAIRDLWRRLEPAPGADARRQRWAGAGRALLVLAVLWALSLPLERFGRDHAYRTLWTPAKKDEARELLLAYVRGQTAEDDTLFVWGYYPEIYVLAPRRPATRYSNTNYLTGMLPWENHAPGIDTSEHVVPGAWEILLRELEASRPKLVIDTSVGDHRYYSKYPIEDFPRLAGFLERDYRLAGTLSDSRGRPRFDLWLRREPDDGLIVSP